MPDYKFDIDFFFLHVNKDGFIQNAHKERRFLSIELLHLKNAIEKTLLFQELNGITDEIILSDYELFCSERQKKADEEFKVSKLKPEVKKVKGDLYLIADDSNRSLKIGFSKNVKNRFSSIQTSTCNKLQLLYLIKDCAHLEKETHLKFNDLRTTGEWFKYDQSIIDYFEILKSA